MINEQQQEQAALGVLGLLSPKDEEQLAAELRQNRELREFYRGLHQTMDKVALAVPRRTPPPGLKAKVLQKIQAHQASSSASAQSTAIPPGLHFVGGDESLGWKQLPIRGAWIKFLSFEPQRGYAVLLGKLEPGVRYPAHTNAGPEDFYILTGDLHVGERALSPGDFHHADAGSLHGENYSVAGCTLLAVLTTDDPLVAFAMS
jgi:hypothetical protein